MSQPQPSTRSDAAKKAAATRRKNREAKAAAAVRPQESAKLEKITYEDFTAMLAAKYDERGRAGIDEPLDRDFLIARGAHIVDEGRLHLFTAAKYGKASDYRFASKAVMKTIARKSELVQARKAASS